jgi:hypothetical protein
MSNTPKGHKPKTPRQALAIAFRTGLKRPENEKPIPGGKRPYFTPKAGRP